MNRSTEDGSVEQTPIVLIKNVSLLFWFGLHNYVEERRSWKMSDLKTFC